MIFNLNNLGSIICVSDIIDDALTIPATIFIVIGALVFLSQASKFINQALGIKNDEKSFASKVIGTVGGAAALAVGGAAVGAIGGVVGGGGLAGLKAGALSGINNGLHNGKIGASFNQGLDLGYTVKTGGKDTKYKNFVQNAQESTMQNSAARKLGFNNAEEVNKEYDRLKGIKIDMDAKLDEAKAAYTNGDSFEFQGQTYSGESLRRLIYTEKTGLLAVAGKANSKFNDFSSQLAASGLGSEKNDSMTKAMEASDWFDQNFDKSNGNAYRAVPNISTVSNSTVDRNIDHTNNVNVNDNVTSTNNVTHRTLAEQINYVNNVHEASSYEEHQQRQGDLNELFGSNAGQDYLNRNEAEADRLYGKTSDTNNKKILGPDGKPLN